MPCLIKGTKETLILWNKETSRVSVSKPRVPGFGKAAEENLCGKKVVSLEEGTPFT